MHRYFRLAALLAAAAGVLFVAAAGEAGGRSSSSLYIVQFVGKPLATYAGGVKGFHATRPLKGARINTHTFNAARYRNYLTNRQHTVLGRAGIASRPVYRFTTVLNGAVLKLTAQQAAKLRGTRGVAAVEKNRIFTIGWTGWAAWASGPDLAVGLQHSAADSRVPRPHWPQRRLALAVRRRCAGRRRSDHRRHRHRLLA